jgi:hypothetical protein
MKLTLVSNDYRSTLKTVFTAKPAISRILLRISIGRFLKVVVVLK